MGPFYSYINQVRDWIWGAPTLALLIGTGVYLTFILRGLQFRYLWYGVKQIFAKRKEGSIGDISHFEALMTSLGGAIGTGAIVGVSTAIAIGGLGALFWMWVMAFFGMATKYSESLLAVKYREIDKRGEMIGGPMEYMEKGLGKRWMAILFATFGSVAAIGTGNLVQVNSIAEAVSSIWFMSPWITGVVLAVITGLVLVGGVRSIGHFTGVLVPIMSLFYIGGGVIIIFLHIDQVPSAIGMIISSAFHGQAATGGFMGASVITAIQMGVSRGVFSNEAGLGISSIAAAAAKTDAPGRQAMITMTGTLLSTLIVCTITGLVIAVTGVFGQVDESGKMINGAVMAIGAFNSAISGGNYIVSIGLILFAFSTVIAWAYYGEKCFEYLFGEKAVYYYRVLFVVLIIPGAALDLELVWAFADISNGLMIIPNLIALVGLSKVIVSETRSFIITSDLETGKKQHGMA
ncbi:MAG: Amino-acid carrier protein AlsT [Chlamydiae bacterium]|nr:Amino-acid carrier protein AlsT [Chlamydiota bacterium]